MGLSLQHLATEADEALSLKEKVNSGALVIEIEPGLVEPSFVVDRLDPGAGDKAFAELVESIRARGQQVPILVRPHPHRPGHYQIAYGHRRWRAAKLLAATVKAVVRHLTDDELVVAQGKENSERRDLTFIERALFARHLDERGFDRATLTSALAVQTAEITRYLAVARSIPDAIVEAVGPAPKAGRPRWMALAERLSREDSSSIVEQVLADPGFRASSTDARFAFLFRALTSEPSRPAPPTRSWANPEGQAVVRFEQSTAIAQLTVYETVAPAFGAFIMERMPELYAAFAARPNGPRAGGLS